MTDLQTHWDQAYTSKLETGVSWYQPLLAKPLEFIRKAAPDNTASVLDIGGGASTLPSSLLDAGYTDVTVLDISQAALARSQERMGKDSNRVQWLIADITAWTPHRTWDVWHDRAVFHFLTETATQDRYIAALRAGTEVGSTLVISTFALDGPERCSGLPVQRYTPESLAGRIGDPFNLVDQHAERHTTPGGSIQGFSYAVLRRT